MRKFIVTLCCVLMSASLVEARPMHGGHGAPHHHPAPVVVSHRHHHHHGDAVAGFFAGLIGGTILNYAVNTPASVTTTTYAPISYVPTTVVSPVVATPAVVSTTTQPCYTSSNIVTGATVTNCPSIITSSPIVTQMYITN